jgi:predicted TIM-barrel fold metal-dependent hydrolase
LLTSGETRLEPNVGSRTGTYSPGVTGPLVVDAHVHVLPPAEDGRPPVRDPYDIWEYGDKPDVEVLDTPGTIEEVSAAMKAAGCDHFVALNMFVSGNELARMAAADPSAPPPTFETHLDALRERLHALNKWAVELAAGRADMTPFAAVDPSVLGGDAGAAELAWAAERGALGVKIHPVGQGFRPDDPRMDAIWDVCVELDLAVVAHSGASRGMVEWAEPLAFAPLLARYPKLKLVLAHLGGARWSQASELAEAFPQVAFDLCEIVAWDGAPHAPSRDELGRLIGNIGSDRVLFGTDFPWYDVARTVEQVLDLPHLADQEKEAILGANAARILALPVSPR